MVCETGFEDTMCAVGARFYATDVRKWADAATATSHELKEACFSVIVTNVDKLSEELVGMGPHTSTS